MVPRYHQIHGILRQRVLSGVYAEGIQLPPEDALAAEFGVSRATIRQAIGLVVTEQLVERQHGRGTFVRPSQDWGTQPREAGIPLPDLNTEFSPVDLHTVDLQELSPLPLQLAHKIGLPDGMGTLVKRVRFIDGRPFSYTSNYVVPEVGRRLIKRPLLSESLIPELTDCGVHLSSATQVVQAQLADLYIAEHLKIEFGEAVLYIERTLHNVAGDPVLLACSWYRASRYEAVIALPAAELPTITMRDRGIG